MENLKPLYLALVLIIPCFCFCQSNSTNNLSQSCDSIVTGKFDTLVIESLIVEYKILSKYEAYYDTNKKINIYNSEVIIPNLSKNIDKDTLDKIFQIIMRKHKIDQIIGFRDCESSRIFHQAMKPLPSQEKHLKENFIGEFKIHL